jgi:BirA family transcriptional regulator, biotin operon repressor / biotin---[acetyl-CoA-carboxylase] ligase
MGRYVPGAAREPAGPREFHEEIASTQRRATELAREGAEAGTYVVARVQTAGRGRLDHAWSSPPGGLYLSIVLRAPLDHVTLLPLSIGARLAEGFRGWCGEEFGTKWPNDVLAGTDLLGRRKVAGILMDRVHVGRGGTAEVAGIGVNVTTDPAAFPAELRDRATTLARVAGRSPALEEVEALAVRSAVAASDGLQVPGGPESTRALCHRWLWGLGRRASVDGGPAGTIVGIGEEGELLLDRGGERVAIRAGDVRVEGFG